MTQTIDDQAVGERLKAWRGERSQREVAEAAGLKQAAYSTYERGTRQVPADAAVRLARYFRKPLEELLGVKREKVRR